MVEDLEEHDAAEEALLHSSQFATAGETRRGTGTTDAAVWSETLMQMQREHSRQMRELQQQMLVREQRAEAEQLRTQEEHRETLRLMREQIAGLAAPRPTVAASAPLPTTAQQERAPVVTDSVQSHSVAASVSLPAPAPPGGVREYGSLMGSNEERVWTTRCGLGRHSTHALNESRSK